jgi:hypothetical protein
VPTVSFADVNVQARRVSNLHVNRNKNALNVRRAQE